MTELLTRGRTSGLVGVHRNNSSKETIKRSGHSVAEKNNSLQRKAFHSCFRILLPNKLGLENITA